MLTPRLMSFQGVNLLAWPRASHQITDIDGQGAIDGAHQVPGAVSSQRLQPGHLILDQDGQEPSVCMKRKQALLEGGAADSSGASH